MEFKEVEYIIKEVIVKVEDKIFLKELIGHMHSWDFTIKTVQGIRAEMNNYGEACAVLNFLDAVKKRPVSFPKMIAALKHTQQMDVYDIFLKQVRRYFNKNEVRLAEVLSMISKEEEDLGIKEVHDDIGAVGSFLVSSSGGYRRSNNRSGNRYSLDIYRRGCSWDSTLSSDKPRKAQLSTSLDDKLPGATGGYRRSNNRSGNRYSQDIYRRGCSWDSTLSSDKPIKAQPSTSLDDNLPGATGKADHNSQNLFQPRQALDPNFAGASISDLKANVYKMLGQALEGTNTHGNGSDPWWNYVLIHSDINVNRNEQRKIGKQRSPGVEVLDILDELGYTLADLHRLFTQFRINEALNILHQHQDKVIDERTSNRENENNMNVNQRSKTDATKEIDLSFLHIDTSEEEHDICKEGHVQGYDIESGGVVKVPPRSLKSDDKEFTKKTGVNIVPPSLESQSSREITENSCQSGDDENNQTTGSIREPDLIQGGHCGTGPRENVSADENPEN